MEMMPPIPRLVLVHDIEVIKPERTDVWGKRQGHKTNIRYVKVETLHSQRFSLSGDTPEISAMLYYDCMNSYPQNFSFETGDIVRFRGKEYTVKKIKECYGTSGEIHHLEVELA